MCECVKELEKKTLDYLRGEGRSFKKPVVKTRLKDVSFPVIKNTLVMRTSSDLEIELEGQKKKPTKAIIHSFCPFCGVKYELLNNEK